MKLSSEAVIAAVAVLVNIVGFIFVIRQIKQQSLATRGETYTSLCGLSYDILMMIADRPYLYEFFYNNKELTADYPHRIEVLCCCEMIANYCDNTLTQKENMPRSAWRKWKKFIRQQIEISLVLKGFFEDYAEWYSPEITEILREIKTYEIKDA